MSFNVKIEGFDEMAAYGQQLLQMFQQFPQKVQALGEEATQKMKKEGPKLTGRMTNEINIKKGSGNNLFTINLPTPYTGFVVFGHRSRAGRWVSAQDFVTPNVIWLKKNIPAALGQKPS